MQGAAQTLNPAMMRALKEFQVASASFPDFCRDWARKLLIEKWMRDAKINDIFEGTQQINMLIVARRILDYSRAELP